MKIIEFLIDYCQRHAHPLNAALHLVGVPAVFIGVYKMLTGDASLGWELFIFGYVLQYFGHKIQGNEVGEVTLIKNIIRGIQNRAGQRHGL